MTIRRRNILILSLGLGAVVALALGGYAAVRARAAGPGAHQSLAPVATPSHGPSAAPRPEYERWTVGRALGPVTVYRQPRHGAPVKTRLGRLNANGYPTLVLVDTIKEIDGEPWYRVRVAMRPNGSRGWVRQGQLSFYTTTAKIVIDLSERRLRVYRRGELKGEFPVAVGRRGMETPTGYFFINQKLRPPYSGGAFGVLAIGISAFQPKLPDWVQGGPVAIHGTNQDELIGKAVSHGCVRMHNQDVLAVSRWVPSGSPVIVER